MAGGQAAVVNRSAILLVHPDREPARDLANGLRAAGFDVVTVPDGERAIDRFIQEPFGVLVTEMALPGRDGGTTAESIRWAPDGQQVTIILLATRGSGVDALKEAAERNRAATTYLGPVETERIVKLVADAVEDPRPTLPEPHGRPPAHETAATDAARGLALGSPGAGASPSAEAAVTVSPARAHANQGPIDDARSLPSRPELTPGWRAGDDPTAEREGQAVEAHAAYAERSSAVFAGDLRHTSFPALLYRVGAMRSTGALVLADDRDLRRTTTGEHCKKAIFFRLGVPVYVQSNLIEECLGHILARAGRITPEQLEESLAHMRRSDARQGTVLLEMRAIDPRGLREALQDQLRVKLFDLFAWSHGEFRFSTKMAPPAETVTLDMSLPETILRGIVHRIAPTRLLGLMSPHLDHYVIPRMERLQAFAGLSMPPEARKILSRVDGMTQLRELLSEAGKRPGAAAQMLYALECVDGIEFSSAPQETPIRAAIEPAATGTGTSEELRQAAALLRADRFEEAIGVPLSDAAAVHAIQELRERFQLFTEPGSARRGLRALAYEVTARLARLERTLSRPPPSPGASVAHRLPRPPPALLDGEETGETDVTGSPSPADKAPGRGATMRLPRSGGKSQPLSDRRETQRGSGAWPNENELALEAPRDQDVVASFVDRAIDEAIRRPSGSKPASPVGTEAPSVDASLDAAELGEKTVDENPDPENFQNADAGRGQKSRLPRLPDGSDDDPVLPAASLLPGAAPHARGHDFDDETELQDGDDPLSPLSADPVVASDTDLDERVQRLYQAERLFRRGCRALARNRYDAALGAFGRAVSLCPDEGEFVTHLAYARFVMSRDPRETAAAMGELRRGCDLSPKLASVHVLFARASKAQGETRLARDAYTQALAADPECQEAIEGLQGLGPFHV